MFQKRILQFLVGILILITAFLGGYLINQNKQNPSSLISTSLQRFSARTSIKTYDANNAFKLKQISPSKVLSAVNGESDKITYLEKESGKIIKISVDGLYKEIISGSTITNIEGGVWSPRKSPELIYIRNRQSHYFDIKNDKTTPLNPAIKSVIFSPSGDKIAYHFFDSLTGKGSINISQPDGSIYKSILETRLPSIVINWPQKNIFSFYKRAVSSEAVDMFLLDISSTSERLSLTKILENKRELEVLFSPSGDKFIYSFFDSDNILRAVVRNLDNQREQSAPFATFAKKCAWEINEKALYCGVPIQMPNKPIKPAYVISKDKIIKWNLDSPASKQEVEVIIEPSSFDEIHVSAPFLSPLENYFFFINFLDNHLYRLAI